MFRQKLPGVAETAEGASGPGNCFTRGVYFENCSLRVYSKQSWFERRDGITVSTSNTMIANHESNRLLCFVLRAVVPLTKLN